MLKKNKNKISLILMIVIVLVMPMSVWSANLDEEVEKMQSDIKAKQDRIEDLKKEISVYNTNLDKYRSQGTSLRNQILILDSQIEKAEKEIELNEAQIDAAGLEIKDTEDKMELNKQSTEDQKLKLGEFLSELNRMDRKNDLEVILTNSSIAEFFNEVKNLEVVQKEVADSLQRLKIFKAQLEQHRANLEVKKANLEDLKMELEASRDRLADQKGAKESLLADTKKSEAKFSSLVSKLKAEQADANADIVALEKTIRQKLQLKESQAQQKLGDAVFSWPVSNKGITATFHDPDYPFRYIFEHPAIDIRAGQGDVIKAPADGYVGRVADNGYGYSYLMLIHSDGFSTVYGHVSKFLVSPDQFVSKGDPVALVGGMPGTKGAGRLTTGPHLHFEIRKNGIPVNPLNYLP